MPYEEAMDSLKLEKSGSSQVISFKDCNESLRERDQTSLSAMCHVGMNLNELQRSLSSLIKFDTPDLQLPGEVSTLTGFGFLLVKC